MGNFTDLTVVDVSNIALVAQLANRRDNCSGTGAEYLFQLAVVGSLHNVSDRQALLGYRNAPVLEQLDAAHTGNARQNGANSRSGVNGAVDLEEAVHGADFLNVLVLNAVQPQSLLVAQLVCLYLRDQGCSVVAAALGEAGAARAGTSVLILDEDLNRIDAGGVISADRRAYDDELVGAGGANAQMRLGSDDKRTDVQAGALSVRNPVLIEGNNGLNSLNEILYRQARQAHAMVGVDHTLCILVRAEQLNGAVRGAVSLQTLKGLHCVMENHRCRIKLKRLIWYDAGVVPALFLIVVNDQHVIGIINAKAEVAFVRLCFRSSSALCCDLQHGCFTLSV